MINWWDDVTITHVIHYKEVLYDMSRVDGIEGYKVDIILCCRKRP